jgi:hypothetical protein
MGATAARVEIPLPCRVPELLGLARDHVPEALIPPATWERLEQIADLVPPVASEAALECRLEEGLAPADFEVCLRRGRRRLADSLSDTAWCAATARSAAWRRVHAFLRAWSDPLSRLHRAVAVVWLEFDVPEEDGAPEPFLVFTLDPEQFYASGSADPGSLMATLRTGLGHLTDRLDPQRLVAVDRCLAGLPRSGQLLHAAIRPSAEGDLIRLIARMPWRELPACLERLDWPGSIPTLRSHLERLCQGTLVHSVNLDVGATLGPRVGIEFHQPTAPGEDPRWRALFDGLEAAGACTREKRHLLEKWVTRHGSQGSRRGIRVQRDLLVKVVHVEDAPLRAKAYLPFGPRLAVDARGEGASRSSRAGNPEA